MGPPNFQTEITPLPMHMVFLSSQLGLLPLPLSGCDKETFDETGRTEVDPEMLNVNFTFEYYPNEPNLAYMRLQWTWNLGKTKSVQIIMGIIQV